MAGKKSYFVADAHLGLKKGDPAEREARFLAFLKSIHNPETAAVYLLGDIWDFWYEYRDVVPREAARVVAELISMMDDGIEVVFTPGNHDIWCYSYFESLGMKKVMQPGFMTIDGVKFCIGHGDAIGRIKLSYRFLLGIFKCRVAQVLFSTLHPWFAFRFGNGWSNSNRKSHKKVYHFIPEKEPLFEWACSQPSDKAEVFMFGHFHDAVDTNIPSGARFVILKDWIDGGTPHAVLQDGILSVISF